MRNVKNKNKEDKIKLTKQLCISFKINNKIKLKKCCYLLSKLLGIVTFKIEL